MRFLSRPRSPSSSRRNCWRRGKRCIAQNCSRCHGTDGQGTRRAPALNVQTFFDKVTTDAAMIQIVSSGVPGTAMPAWGDRMSVSEIEAIVAYVRSWEATAPAVATAQTTGGGGPPWQRTGSIPNQPQTPQTSGAAVNSSVGVAPAADWRMVRLLRRIRSHRRAVDCRQFSIDPAAQST